MARFTDIQSKLSSLSSDTLWGIAEIICDLEEQLEDRITEIESLEKALAEAEAQL